MNSLIAFLSTLKPFAIFASGVVTFIWLFDKLDTKPEFPEFRRFSPTHDPHPTPDNVVSIQRVRPKLRLVK